MISARAAVLWLAGALALGGCGSGSGGTPAPPPQRALSEGTVAQVGRHAITAPLVAHVAAAQRISVTEARDRAVRDALLASEAEAEKLDGKRDVQLGTRSILARRLLRDLAIEAGKAPITDQELDETTALHWLDLDRPEAFQVVHSVVRLAPDADAQKRAEAQAIAESLRAAVLAVHDRAGELPKPPPPREGESAPRREAPQDPLAAAFLKAAEAVPHPGLEVVSQELWPVTAAGRVLKAGKDERYDPDFSRAAAALRARGELSPITASTSGLHVIMLIEQIPEQRVPAAERHRVLRDEIMAKRARAVIDPLLAAARTRAERAGDVDALLALVGVDQ